MAGSTPDFGRAVAMAQDGQAGAAVAIFADLAQAGHRAAQVNLAVMLARGQGVPQDDQAALAGALATVATLMAHKTPPVEEG